MLTASENLNFRKWLCVVDQACVDLAGITLQDVASRLESRGELPPEGLLHSLHERQRRGYPPRHAALDVLTSAIEYTNPADCDPSPADQAGRFLAIAEVAMRTAIDEHHAD